MCGWGDEGPRPCMKEVVKRGKIRDGRRRVRYEGEGGGEGNEGGVIREGEDVSDMGHG